MAVAKKKKTDKIPIRKTPVWKWTPQRKRAALLLSLGTKKYEDVSSEVGVNERTLYEWRQNEDFVKEVDRLTHENEKATKAGLLRLAFKALEEKNKRLTEDRSTALDWANFVVNLEGLSTQKVELDANIRGELDGARELLASRIASVASRVRKDELSGESDEQTGSSPQA